MRVAESPTESTAVAVGRRVKEEMDRQSIRQTAVAKRLRLSQSAVSRRLLGVVPFDVEELEILSSLLDVPTTVFLGVSA